MPGYSRRNVTVVVLASCLTVAVGVLVALLVIGPSPRPRVRGPAATAMTPPPAPPPVAAAPSTVPVEPAARAPLSPAPSRPKVAVAPAAHPKKPAAGPPPPAPPVAVADAGTEPPAIETARPLPPGKKPAADRRVALVERFGKAVVQVEQQKDGKTKGLGSGFIVSPDGFVVTNYHVIDSSDGATKLVVKLSTGEQVQVRAVVATDADRDLAVLSIGRTNLPTVPLGNSDLVRQGEEIVVIGSPLGLSNTVSVGVVSAIRDLKDGTQLIQITAQIAPGNSGGPVFNAAGQVVGVVVLKIPGQEGLGFCIPVRDVIPIVQGLPKVKAG